MWVGAAYVGLGLSVSVCVTVLVQSKKVDCAVSGELLEVIWSVGDPVGSLLFSALGRGMSCEQGFESLRLLLHALDGPLGGRGSGRVGAFRRGRGS